MVQDIPLKVAAYCRVSTDKEEQLSSLESQKRYFREYIDKNDKWELVEVYYDEGVSGTSTKHREGFNRMIDDVYMGKIELIITKEVSRFARNTVDTLTYTRQLKREGVGVLFINDNINTLEADGELRLAIMASIAQEESRKTSERVKWGQKRRMEQGVVFGRSLLGYDVRNGRLHINSEGAEIVRLIFHKYVNEGKGSHVIARELSEAGVRPMRVKEWSNTVILRILRNEKYVGDLCQKKTYTPDYLSHSKKSNNGVQEKVCISNHHEPIIERSMWDEAQRILAGRTPTDEQKTRYSCRYWCSGRIVCGECGEKFVSRTKKRKDGTLYKAWRCADNARHGSENGIGCSNISVNERVISEGTAYVLRLLDLSCSAIIEEMAGELRSVSHESELNIEEPLNEKIRRIETKKIILLESYLEGIVSTEDYINQNRHYNEQTEQIRQKLRRQKAIQAETFYRFGHTEKCIERIKEYLDFETPDEHICGELLEKITVYKDKILEIKLKYVPAVRLKFTASGRLKSYKISLEVVS